MRRWSKEPRRMSVVEGSAAASLTRAARVLSVCFIYIYETIKESPCQELFEHFYQILFFGLGARLPRTDPRPVRTMTLPCPSRRMSAATRAGHFSEQRTDSLPSRKIALA